jgi:hypothetical protein
MREDVECGLEVVCIGGEHEAQRRFVELDNVDISELIAFQGPRIPGVFEPKTSGNHLDVGHESTHPRPEQRGLTKNRLGTVWAPLEPLVPRQTRRGQADRSSETSSLRLQGWTQQISAATRTPGLIGRAEIILLEGAAVGRGSK